MELLVFLALLAASANAPPPAGPSDADVREVDCRTMSQDEKGEVVALLLPDLHVLKDAALEGPYRLVLPPGVTALHCRRNSIVPAEHDDEVLALGLPLYLAEARAGGRAGVLEISSGQFRYRMVKGELLPDENELVQARLNQFQMR